MVQVRGLLIDQGPRVRGLPLTAVVCLMAMALEARDTASSQITAGLYFGGWQHLALVLGYPEGDLSGKRAVARALAELRIRGLAEPVARRGFRGNRVYRLHLLMPS